MESFTLLRKDLEFSGIILHYLQPQNSYLINLKRLTLIILASLYEISLIKLLDKANTFDEYTNIFYEVIAVMIYIIFYINIVWKTSNLLQLVDSLENCINNSK